MKMNFTALVLGLALAPAAFAQPFKTPCQSLPALTGDLASAAGSCNVPVHSYNGGTPFGDMAGQSSGAVNITGGAAVLSGLTVGNGTSNNHFTINEPAPQINLLQAGAPKLVLSWSTYGYFDLPGNDGLRIRDIQNSGAVIGSYSAGGANPGWNFGGWGLAGDLYLNDPTSANTRTIGYAGTTRGRGAAIQMWGALSPAGTGLIDLQAVGKDQSTMGRVDWSSSLYDGSGAIRGELSDINGNASFPRDLTVAGTIHGSLAGQAAAVAVNGSQGGAHFVTWSPADGLLRDSALRDDGAGGVAVAGAVTVQGVLSANLASFVGGTGGSTPLAAMSGGTISIGTADAVRGDNSAPAAAIGLVRNISYGVLLGLDTDNKVKIGGWSMGNVAYEILHAGNVVGILAAGPVRAAKGLPTGDTATAGYSFGADGDTGLFADGSGPAGSNLYVMSDNQQLIKFGHGSGALAMTGTYTAGPTDVANWLITRNASYSGGTVGWVNSAMGITVNVSGSPSSYEWPLSVQLLSSASTGQHVAIAGEAIATGTAEVWGGYLQMYERAVGGSGVGLEIQGGRNVSGAIAIALDITQPSGYQWDVIERIPEGVPTMVDNVTANNYLEWLPGGALNISVAVGLKINGGTAVSCAGAPSSSFQSSNGIITHC